MKWTDLLGWLWLTLLTFSTVCWILHQIHYHGHMGLGLF